MEAYRLFAQARATTRRTSASRRPGKPPYAVTKSRRAGWPRSCSTASATRSASRCSATRCPEIAAAFDILQATQRRVRRPELIACPTCGRLAIDLEKIIAELERG